MRRLMLKALIAATALAANGMAAAQEKTFKFALQNPKGHPLEVGASKFAELVAAKSGGKMKVNVFPGGALGGDAANVSALQGGTIEFVMLNSGILASQVKDFEVFDFPFMFANGKEADAVVDGPFGQKLHARLAEKGIVGLAYTELGFRNITNSRKPINTVDDIAGLKLRVIPNNINVDWVKAVGANPTPMAFPEVYAGLEQKAIDGQENPLSVILANKFFEVQKYLTITNHQYNPQSIIFSKKVWDTLSEGDRKVLQDAANEAAKYQRQVNRDKAAGDLQRDLLLPPLLRRLRAQAPGVTLRVIDSGAPVPAMLRDEACQLIVTPRPPDGSDILQKRLFEDRYRVFYDAAQRRAPAGLDDYLGAEHVTVLYEPRRTLDIDRWLVERGIVRRIVATVPGMAGLGAMLRGGDWLATAPALLADGMLRGLTMTEPPLATPPLAMYMVWHQRHQADPVHRWLRDQLEAVAPGAISAHIGADR